MRYMSFSINVFISYLNIQVCSNRNLMWANTEQGHPRQWEFFVHIQQIYTGKYIFRKQLSCSLPTQNLHTEYISQTFTASVFLLISLQYPLLAPNPKTLFTKQISSTYSVGDRFAFWKCMIRQQSVKCWLTWNIKSITDYLFKWCK